MIDRSAPAQEEVPVAPSATSRTCRAVGRCLLAIVGVPLGIALLLFVWLLRHISIIATIELILVVSFFLNTSLHLSSSTTSTVLWHTTIWDILIITVVTSLMVYISEVVWPWPSNTRRASFTLIAGGIIAFVVTKWSAIANQSWSSATGGGHAMLITLAIGSSMQAISQWWIPSSRNHLKASQDRVLELELRDHFATPVDRRAFTIIDKTLAGVSYYLVGSSLSLCVSPQS
jgi:hypothetical protein